MILDMEEAKTGAELKLFTEFHTFVYRGEVNPWVKVSMRILF